MEIVVVIISAVVAIGAVLYTRTAKVDSNTSTLTLGHAMGAGIIGIGILLVAMPWASGAISALSFIGSSDFAILSGAIYALGILVILAGAGIVALRGASEG
jgi:hypothetical protein